MLKKVFLCGASAVLFSQPSLAATLLDQPASTGLQTVPGSLAYTFNAGGGVGLLDFILEGYLTLDGVGDFTDTFNVDLNGTTLLNGSYELGGSGANVTNFIAAGGTFVPMSNGFFLGGSALGSLPVALLNGLNTLTFSYSGVSQGFTDEGFGLNSLRVTGNVVNAGVPEPSTWAMLILGFGTIGGMMRRRSATAKAARMRLTYA